MATANRSIPSVSTRTNLLGGVRSLAKGILRSSVLRGTRLVLGGFRNRLLLWAVAIPGFASFYYCFINRSFAREHSSMLRAKLRHLVPDRGTRLEGDGLPQAFTLRRNIHRLEKGLTMRPRRPVFAQDYIGETVAAYAKVTWPVGRDDDLALWATHVLDEYFSVVRHEGTIPPAWERFSRIRLDLPAAGEGSSYTPYPRAESPSLMVNYEDLLSLARRRRSVRWFQDRPVPRGLLDKAMAVAALSPSACNRQPFKYVIFDDMVKAREIATIPMGTAGYAENIPCLAVIVGQLWAFPYERDRHLIYIDGALSSMAFQFALETLGLASCSINWPDTEQRERRLAKALGLSPEERPIMLLAIGYADPNGKVAYSAKRSLNELRCYNPS